MAALRFIVRTAVIAAVALAACAQSSAAPPERPAPTPAKPGILTPAQAECQDKGGRIQKVCMRGVEICVTPFRDAGKTCSGKKDCEGRCLYEGKMPPGTNATGVCQKDTQPCGCFTTVEDGKVAGGLCVD